jgi:hypothetical protein
MRKLKLDSLTVESFETAAPHTSRGSVQGHEDTAESVCLCPGSEGWECQTWDYDACGDTYYLDCTFACTDFASCQGGC